MTILKLRIRKLLGSLLAQYPVVKQRDKAVTKQAIKYLIQDNRTVPQDWNSNTVGGFIRILASDSKNARDIARLLEQNRDELSLESVHIFSKAFDYSAPKGRDPFYYNSVIIKVNQKTLLKTICPFDSSFKRRIVEDLLESQSNEKVVIDFSSPNIAKPFHFGHLKSTILGNFLANLNTFVGNSVTRLNYIGDWGTQYGLLSLGLSEFSDSNDRYEDKLFLKHLVEIYVEANQRAATDESFYSEAKRRFALMDSDPEQMKKWKRIRDVSLKELIESYSNIGVEFDAFEFESDYAKKVPDLVDRMRELKFVTLFEDGVLKAEVEKNYHMLQVPIQKSDGSSLYITRDIAAAISRKETYDFDRMLYVVGNDQERHFHCLKEIIKYLNYNWHRNLIHVSIGKVRGMSTRSGQFVLLSDIINETTRQYIEFTKKTPTSKVKSPEDVKNVGTNLALSALFVSDMRNYRSGDYNFSWEAVMNPGERSGINLQTTYARLSSLLRRASEEGLEPASLAELDFDSVCCIEGSSLLSHLNELDTALYSSYHSMDSAPLVNHALNMCKSINRARRSDKLWVIGDADRDKARTRLTMFKCAHDQMEFLIKLIGLKPLGRV